MIIDFHSNKLEQIDHPCMVVLALSDGTVINGAPAITELLRPHVENGEFGEHSGHHLYFFNPEGIKAERLMIINLGKKTTKSNDIRKATAKAWSKLLQKNRLEVLLSLDGFGGEQQQRAAVEGFLLGEYRFTLLKSEKDKLDPRLQRLSIHASSDMEGRVNQWKNIVEGVCKARDLCQMPANILTPTRFSELAAEWGTHHGFDTRVLDEDAINKEGMNAMYSVGQGSAQPSQLIIMDYQPERPSGKTIALVGKAVTFDSGGLSLKPAGSMAEMKGDMGGGAAVVGTMTVLRAVACPHRVVGIVPAVENMPSSSATRPSDVVTTLSGLTVEINNTDAEGRLILADALSYAGRFKPDFVVDYATLTGACLVALGPEVFGVMGNHQPLVDAIIEAGNELHEVFWQLPLVEDYNTLLDSDVADISNISSSQWGGTITAGLFLQKFATDYQWAHCDIAASIFDKSNDWQPSGGIGAGVRMTVAMLDKLQ
jgi:leucyl aminopeptidase